MKVKVGDEVYDGTEVPVMVILTDQDKERIRDMPPACTKYALFPVGEYPGDTALEWMQQDGED